MDIKLCEYLSKEVVAIVPARGGSKSVPKKNIRTFYDHPLIAYSIAAARAAKLVDRVIVSTDSMEIAEIAKDYGAEVPFLRPAEYAEDMSPDIDFIKHAIKWLFNNEGKVPKLLIHLRPTTPIRDPDVINDAIKIFLQDESATSLRSVHRCINPPFKYYKKEAGDKYLKPLMPGMTLEETNLPRQGYEEVFIGNNYVDVLSTEVVIRTDGMYGENMYCYVTEELPDIDTELDYRLLSCYKGMPDILEMLRTQLNEHKNGGQING